MVNRVRGIKRFGYVVLSLCCVACSAGQSRSNGVSAIGLTPGEWAALSKPGPSHNLLQTFVGDWDVSLTFWSDPKTRGETSQGRSQISWILGKRFLQEQFSGAIGGEEYQGLGIIGYDNGSRSFKTVWADSLNTALTDSSGRYDPETNTIVLESQVYDPLRSGVKTVQSQLRINSPDSYTFSMTDTSPEGKQFKAFEMHYVRRS